MDRRTFTALTVTASLNSFGRPLAACFPADDSPALSVEEVAGILDDEQWVLVDTRPTDAYGGWKLEGVSRGGHLPGAVDFPASWLTSNHPDKATILSNALQDKGITPDRHVVLYGTNQRDRTAVGDALRQRGFRQLYDFDLHAWANDATRPLERYPNFQLLVPAVVVKQLLDGEKPGTFERTGRVKFAEASWGEEGASYGKGHVPGSFHVNTDHFEPPPSWKLGDAEVLSQFAARYGFEADDTVVVSSEDPTAGYRLAVVLRYMGVADVRVLNGGLAAWKAAQYPVETESTPPPQGAGFQASIPRRPQLIDEINRVATGLAKPDEFTLVDTRTWAEYTGETSGYTYHFRKGRIPGSVYGQASFQGPNSLTPYRNIDNTMRRADEIKALWQEAKIDLDTHLAFFCGGGWRAAEVLTFAHVMGLERTSLYSDGWIGWSNDRSKPIETGPVTPSSKPQ